MRRRRRSFFDIAKDPNVEPGLLANGAQWCLFIDVGHSNVMDKEPFARWDAPSGPTGCLPTVGGNRVPRPKRGEGLGWV
jgi:hypothetical protein